MSLIAKALLISALTLPLAAASCAGNGCNVGTPDDEVSLLQVKLDVDAQLDHEYEEFMNATERRLGIPRARGAQCANALGNAKEDICFISGGANPDLKGDKDHYNEKAWGAVFKGLPQDKCFFCGVRGQYQKWCEGTVMLSCGAHTEQYDAMQAKCFKEGQALKQDTILRRHNGDTRLIITHGASGQKIGDTKTLTCDSGKTFQGIFDNVPVPYAGGPLSSIVAKGETVVFSAPGEPKNCLKGSTEKCV